MAKDPHFIVSHYIFAEHATFAEAEKERIRLSEAFPKHKFKVYGITEEYQNIEMRDPDRKYKHKLFKPTPATLPAQFAHNIPTQPPVKITLSNFKQRKSV
jgi:hypothetical protein